MGTWDAFIAEALADQNEPEDVRSLREALTSGYQLVRVELSWEDRQALPRYDVVLTRPQEPVRHHISIRHSDAFMQWSLEAGAKLLNREQEVLRTQFLLQEPLRTTEQELGSAYFNSILLEHLRTLGPPRTLSLLAGYDRPPAPASTLKTRALSALDELLKKLARNLKTLGYTEEQVSGLLDRTLERYVDERFQLSLRRSLFSR